MKLLLVVEDNPIEQSDVAALLGEDGVVEVTSVANGVAALAALDERSYDCMVVDLVLPELDGIRLIEEVRARESLKELPIVVYTGKDLDPGEEASLRRSVHSIITKTGPHSVERLVEDTNLFLHRVETSAPSLTKDVAPPRGDVTQSLLGTTVLIVDDDIRNIFALSSLLETRGARVIFAENGRAGIEALSNDSAVDIVLMDVMMPEMDGYETTKAIRSNAAYAALPIIAVTAKALKEDRDKCMSAGASDYLAKPVDADKLFELIGLWTQAR